MHVGLREFPDKKPDRAPRTRQIPPYDVFVKAQIAADLPPAEGRDKLLPGLGLYGVGPGDAEDRVDVTTRTFLGMTVGCARCHNRKYDPIPAKDYYSLIGIFRSTDYAEIPLAPDAEVKEYQRIKDQIKKQKREIDDFIEKHSTELGELLATKTAQYMVSSWNVMRGIVPSAEEAATNDKLDLETLNRCIRYLKTGEREHAYPKQWDAVVQAISQSFSIPVTYGILKPGMSMHPLVIGTKQNSSRREEQNRRGYE